MNRTIALAAKTNSRSVPAKGKPSDIGRISSSGTEWLRVALFCCTLFWASASSLNLYSQVRPTSIIASEISPGGDAGASIEDAQAALEMNRFSRAIGTWGRLQLCSDPQIAGKLALSATQLKAFSELKEKAKLTASDFKRLDLEGLERLTEAQAEVRLNPLRETMKARMLEVECELEIQLTESQYSKLLSIQVGLSRNFMLSDPVITSLLRLDESQIAQLKSVRKKFEENKSHIAEKDLLSFFQSIFEFDEESEGVLRKEQLTKFNSMKREGKSVIMAN